jgi:hypothetical protein
MAKEPDNLVLRLLREMRVDANVEFARLNETLQDVRRHVVSLDMRAEALDEKFETIRPGGGSGARSAIVSIA